MGKYGTLKKGVLQGRYITVFLIFYLWRGFYTHCSAAVCFFEKEKM
jgi:hypothetical protein